METVHELWPGGPRYAGESVSLDSLALAAFADGGDAGTACDLGCGCGILMLLLAAAHPALRLTGVELRQGAAERCRENLRRNGLEGRCACLTGDFRFPLLPPESVDLVVSNPPFFPAGSGPVSSDRDRALRRFESATLPELCAAAARLLRPAGRFCLVHRVQRRDELLSALSGAGLSPARLRELLPREGAKGELFLCEARKSPAVCRVEPPLCQWGPDGRETAEYRKICHWE